MNISGLVVKLLPNEQMWLITEQAPSSKEQRDYFQLDLTQVRR